ncbi:fluoride efflux transporter CrcB [Jiella sp. R10]|uniref:Fluoride efflux transporter CrcB n=2 Tax=Antarcticirhabdus aurantiaca TaxID=2606717 RepID=A0ACD4NX01_9HYPH|nr:fluoride efflux transporter CrcB [Jeongeuplla avenae]
MGSVARYLSTLAATRLFGSSFPWGTLFVNLLGSFLMGIVVEVVARRFDASNELRLLLGTGVLGGFTTFSSFTLDAAMLAERGELALAFFYVAGSVLLGLAALFAGLALARSLA